MTAERKIELRDKVKGMFDHGYGNYMGNLMTQSFRSFRDRKMTGYCTEHAFPQDELDPVNCKGRSRDDDPENWGINDVLGNFSLTLIDSLDAHFIMNDRPLFEESVRLVIEHIKGFDNLDVRVQVFEVTIRVLGALLSAHLIADDEGDLGYRIPWYEGELLDLAQELGDCLLPAFDTSTGIPFPRVNLRGGVLENEAQTTCSAGAGTLILEFGVLSRLTGDPTYENVARKALAGVWDRRSPLGLIGNTIGIMDGLWYDPMAGIGAGIDSFYEYLFKAYVLFGEREYFDIFQKGYEALTKHVRDQKGLIWRNVNMFTGALAATWIDSLAAFFPGLQVLAGDIEGAAKLHQVYFSIWTRYNALPERFDFKTRSPAISSYPLRPELIESTYMLYRATGESYYLEVGERILEDLEEMARLPCGYATLQDVTLRSHEPRMESFFLSETLKYLYLLFDEENFIHQNHGNHVFTTEGHLLFLSYDLLAEQSYQDSTSGRKEENLTCTSYTPVDLPVNGGIRFPNFAAAIPLPEEEVLLIHRLVGLRNDGVVGEAAEYLEKLQTTHDIKISSKDGKIHPAPRIIPVSSGLYVDHLNGATIRVRQDGQEYAVVQLNGFEVPERQSVVVPRVGIWFLKNPDDVTAYEAPKPNPLAHLILDSGVQEIVAQANFGPVIVSDTRIPGLLVIPNSGNSAGCDPHGPDEADGIRGKIMLVPRGECSFAEKTRWAEQAGAIAIIVSNTSGHGVFPMAGPSDVVDTTGIPSVMISAINGAIIRQMVARDPRGHVEVVLKGMGDEDESTMKVETQLQWAGKPIKNLKVVPGYRRLAGEGRRDTRGSSLMDPGSGFWCLRHCITHGNGDGHGAKKPSRSCGFVNK
ncbi:alpha mannosidase-like protein [Thoreauomyces humboldtii]|nr:alpha mannosidase-like protein [Thoreauomyces humboldtii]